MSTQTKSTPDTLSDDATSLFDEDLLDLEEEEKSALTVDSPADAQKLFRAARALQEEIAKLEAEMEVMIEEIEEFYGPKIESRNDQIHFLKSKINEYVTRTGESVSVPAGMAYQQTRTSWEYADTDDIVSFCEEHYPDLVEVEKKVNKNDLKQRIKDDWDPAHEDDPPITSRSQETSVVCYTEA